MTYTEAQVMALVESATDSLKAEVAELKSKLSKVSLQREEAEKKYTSVCEECITAFLTHKDIITDTIIVQVSVPRFLSASNFETGMAQHLISILSKERERAVFMSDNTQSRRNNNEPT